MTLCAEFVCIVWTVGVLAFTVGYIMGASVNVSKEYDRVTQSDR
jgi:hypothetical protein